MRTEKGIRATTNLKICNMTLEKIFHFKKYKFEDPQKFYLKLGVRKDVSNMRDSQEVLSHILSDISERNNDYSDTLDFRRG